MTYAKIIDNLVSEYPVYEGEIKLRFPNISFAQPFTPPEGYEPVTQTTAPTVNYRYNVIEVMPVWVDGVLTQAFDIVPVSTDEQQRRIDQQWTSIRNLRNAKLANSDWTQVADAPVDALAWAAYRQDLRDITLQEDPFDIVWPQEPS